MKRAGLLAGLAMVFFVATAFRGCEDWVISSWKRVKGNGEIVTQWRPITGAVTVCEIERMEDVECRIVENADSTGVRLSGDANLLELITVQVTQKGKLRVRPKESWVHLVPTETLRVTILVPGKLRGLSLGGDIKVVDTTALAGDTVFVDVAGWGEVPVEVEASRVSIEIAGSGKVWMRGKARKMSIDIAGSGSVDAVALQVDSCCVDIAGSGTCRVFATEYLSVDVAGSGDICFRGAPRIKQSIAGSGSVTPCRQE